MTSRWRVLAILGITGSLLLAGPVYAQPVSRPTGSTTQPASFSTPDASYARRLARRVEPSAVGRLERLEHYVRQFEQAVVRDTRIFAFSVQASSLRDQPVASRNGGHPDHHGIRVSGYVEFSEHHRLLLQFLNHLGFPQLVDEVEVLPAETLGTRRFACVKNSHTVSYDHVGQGRTAVTECLLGEPLWLLKETGDQMFLCHSGDGYVGHVVGSALQRMDEQQFSKYHAGARVRLLTDVTVSNELTVLIGTQLKLVRHRGACVTALLPTGETVELAEDACQITDGTSHQQLEAVIRTARQMLDAPYLWGGKTSSGVDCSGLMQVAFAAHGLHLPRDASQQVYLGKLTATRWHRRGMRRGDTLYFLGPRGNIAHTGIYLGAGDYLEATAPVATVTSIRPGAPNYDARRDATFAFAKRLIE